MERSSKVKDFSDFIGKFWSPLCSQARKEHVHSKERDKVRGL